MLNSLPLYRRLRALVWQTPLAGQPAWRVALVEAGQIAWVVARDLLDGRLNLWAMSLVYTTLLSLVPALAIAFAVFRAFGYDNYVEQMLTEFLAPLGQEGQDVTLRVMEFVNRVNANVLGSVGFAFLLYTVVSMAGKVESAFNSIWHVEASRSLARQFTEIVSMGVLGPVIVFTAIAIMAGTLSNSFIGGLTQFAPIHFLIDQASRAVPYALLIATFAFLYAMVPNTRVRLSAAIAGATIAGIAWGAAGWAFATFVVRSAQYVAIYSAFASLVVFMIWLYASWLILLTGCAIAFYFQNRRHLSPVAGLGLLTRRQRERMAVQTMVLIHEAFTAGQAPWTGEALSNKLRLPMEALQAIERALRRAGLIVHSMEESGGLVPGKPAELVRVSDVLAAVRFEGEADIQEEALGHDPRVETFSPASPPRRRRSSTARRLPIFLRGKPRRLLLRPRDSGSPVMEARGEMRGKMARKAFLRLSHNTARRPKASIHAVFRRPFIPDACRMRPGYI